MIRKRISMIRKLIKSAHSHHFPDVTKMIILPAIAAALATSCGVCRRQPTITVRDSIRTEVKEVTTYIHDTVEVTLPKETEKVVTRDTSSRLENTFSISNASIDKTGFLHHSLISKGSPLAVPVDVPMRRKDSIVYVDKVKEVRVPVMTEKPLTWWQQTRLRGFWILLAILGFWLVIKFSPVIKNILRILKIPFS